MGHHSSGLDLRNRRGLLFCLFVLTRLSRDSNSCFFVVVRSSSKSVVRRVIISAEDVVSLVSTGLVIHLDGSDALRVFALVHLIN